MRKLLFLILLSLFLIISCENPHNNISGPQDLKTLSKNAQIDETNSDCIFIMPDWGPISFGMYSQNGNEVCTLYADVSISSPTLIGYSTYSQNYETAWFYSNSHIRFDLPNPALSVTALAYDNTNLPGHGTILRAFNSDDLEIGSAETTDEVGFNEIEVFVFGDDLISYVIFEKYDPTWTYTLFGSVNICYAPQCTLPAITLEASRDIIWPPNNKLVSVDFLGTVESDCDATVTYTLTDEYGKFNSSGEVYALDGEYAFSLVLKASRKGKDKDGRSYTLTVTATNEAGSASASVDMVVPHNKRKK